MFAELVETRERGDEGGVVPGGWIVGESEQFKKGSKESAAGVVERAAGEVEELERQFEEFADGVEKSSRLCDLYVAGVWNLFLEIPREEKKDEQTIV